MALFWSRHLLLLVVLLNGQPFGNLWFWQRYNEFAALPSAGAAAIAWNPNVREPSE